MSSNVIPIQTNLKIFERFLGKFDFSNLWAMYFPKHVKLIPGEKKMGQQNIKEIVLSKQHIILAFPVP